MAFMFINFSTKKIPAPNSDTVPVCQMKTKDY